MFKTGILSVMVLAMFILGSSFFQKYDLPKSIERGKEVYTSYCMNCHMEDGKGTDIFPPVAKGAFLKKEIPAVYASVFAEASANHFQKDNGPLLRVA